MKSSRILLYVLYDCRKHLVECIFYFDSTHSFKWHLPESPDSTPSFSLSLATISTTVGDLAAWMGSAALQQLVLCTICSNGCSLTDYVLVTLRGWPKTWGFTRTSPIARGYIHRQCGSPVGRTGLSASCVPQIARLSIPVR
jgi:hypothetical protein